MQAMLINTAKSKIQSFIQENVIKELTPLIKANLNNIAELKTKIDEKLRDVSSKVNRLIPGPLKEKIDVTMVNGIVDSIDSSVFKTAFDGIIDNLSEDEIKTTGSTKDKLKTDIGGLPDEIKQMFKNHITVAFTGKSAEGASAASTTPVPSAEGASAAPTTPVPSAEGSTDKTLTAAVEKLSEEEQIKIAIDTIKTTGIPPSVFEKAIKLSDAAPAAPAAGGAKKKRRKTKKNIGRNKKAYTKFGRRF